MLVQCWASVADAGPTLNQHCARVSSTESDWQAQTIGKLKVSDNRDELLSLMQPSKYHVLIIKTTAFEVLFILVCAI